VREALTAGRLAQPQESNVAGTVLRDPSGRLLRTWMDFARSSIAACNRAISVIRAWRIWSCYGTTRLRVSGRTPKMMR